jgi:hypothetical protein
MSAGFTVTPVSAAVASGYVGSAAVQGPIAAELPGAKAITQANTVAPTPDTTSTPNGARQPAAASTGSFTQNFTIDPQTHEAIYRLVDARTQQVIQQVPDEAVLASRAYANAIQDGATPMAARLRVNIET